MPKSVPVRAILNRFNWGNLPYAWGAPAQELGSVTKLKRESAWCRHSSPCLWVRSQCDKSSQTLTLPEHAFLPWFLKKYSSQSYRHGSTCLSSWCLGGGDKKTEFNASFSCIISRLSWALPGPTSHWKQKTNKGFLLSHPLSDYPLLVRDCTSTHQGSFNPYAIWQPQQGLGHMLRAHTCTWDIPVRPEIVYPLTY